MFRFTAFRALHYDDPSAASTGDPGVLQLDNVVAPPEISHNSDLRNQYAQANRYNVANLLDPSTGYGHMTDWLAEGIVGTTAEAALYLYRCGLPASRQEPQNPNALPGFRQITGVFGLLHPDNNPAASNPSTSNPSISNPSPTWTPADALPNCWSINAPGFTELANPTGIPLARATDKTGLHHRLWCVTQPGVIQTIAEAVNRHGLSPLLTHQLPVPRPQTDSPPPATQPTADQPPTYRPQSDPSPYSPWALRPTVAFVTDTSDTSDTPEAIAHFTGPALGLLLGFVFSDTNQ